MHKTTRIHTTKVFQFLPSFFCATLLILQPTTIYVIIKTTFQFLVPIFTYTDWHKWVQVLEALES